MNFFRQYPPVALGGLVLCLLATALRAQEVTARFQPEVLSVGELGTYAVILEGFETRGTPRVPPPAIAGLQVVGTQPNVSTQQSFVMDAGGTRRSISTTLSWRIAATREGTFTVPARELVIDGETYTLPSATLRVRPDDEVANELFRFEFDLPDKPFFVGETVPAFLKVYIRSDLRASQPEPNVEVSEGLLLEAAEEPDIRREQVDGVTYHAVIWSLLLTPIRADSFTVRAQAQFEFIDPQNPRYEESFFRRRQVPERKLLFGPEEVLTARPVPREGRLPGFNGAIGQFTSEVSLDTSTVRAGEPVTLTLALSGSGNFDRVAAPEIPETPGWRLYPPRVNFTPTDELGFTGTKSFEYLLIPADETISTTPEIPWTAFNPYSETFLDLSAAPQPVAVAPAPARGEAIDFTERAAASPAPSPREATRNWRPFRAELGEVWRGGVQPTVSQPLFWLAQGGLALGFAFWGGLRWRRHRLSRDESYARRVSTSKTVRRWLKTAEEAAARDDAEAFFAAAQRTVQEAAGRHFPGRRQAASLTLAEILTQLERLQVAAASRDDVSQLFGDADALRYAGLAGTSGSISEHRDRLERIVRAIP